MTAYFLLTSASKFIAKVLQLILYPANEVFRWWIYIVTVTRKVTRERYTKGSESEEGG